MSKNVGIVVIDTEEKGTRYLFIPFKDRVASPNWLKHYQYRKNHPTEFT